MLIDSKDSHTAILFLPFAEMAESSNYTTGAPSSVGTPFPRKEEDFAEDHRISYSKDLGTYTLEHENGSEYEWNASIQNWFELVCFFTP